MITITRYDTLKYSTDCRNKGQVAILFKQSYKRINWVLKSTQRKNYRSITVQYEIGILQELKS